MSNKAWDAGQKGSTGGEHVDQLLSPYIDNDLDAAARAQVRKHLQECADCRADYVELQATRKLLGSLPAVIPPRAFTITPEMAEVHNRRLAKAAGGQRSFWERFFSPHNAPRFAFGSIVSVVLTLVVLAGGLLSGNNRLATSVVALQAPAVSNAPSAGSFKSVPPNSTTLPSNGYEDQSAPAPGKQPLEQTPSALSALAQTPAAAAPTAESGTGGGGAAGAGSSGSAGGVGSVVPGGPGVPQPGGISGGTAAEATPITAAAGAAGLGAQATAAGAVPAEASASATGTSAPAAGSTAQDNLSTGVLASPTTTTPGGRSSISPPEPAHTSSSESPFESAGGGLFLSFSVLFGLLSILLASAALISTRRSR